MTMVGNKGEKMSSETLEEQVVSLTMEIEALKRKLQQWEGRNAKRVVERMERKDK